ADAGAARPRHGHRGMRHRDGPGHRRLPHRRDVGSRLRRERRREPRADDAGLLARADVHSEDRSLRPPASVRSDLRESGGRTTTVLDVLAVLFAGRGSLNFLKRSGMGSGLVFFGHLLPRDTLLAPLVGATMVLYAWGLWTRAVWAIALGVSYAVYAT